MIAYCSRLEKITMTVPVRDHLKENWFSSFGFGSEKIIFFFSIHKISFLQISTRHSFR